MSSSCCEEQPCKETSINPIKIKVDLNFDISKASVNGKVIDYEKQMFLKNGLLIKDTQGIPGLPEQLNNNLFISMTKQLKKFDRNYIMNKFCYEISAAIDRSTNSAYHIISKKLNDPNGTYASIPITFENCVIYLKKIPKKVKYFVSVFKRIPLHKIQILFQDDNFYKRLLIFLINLLKRNEIKNQTNSESFSKQFQDGEKINIQKQPLHTPPSSNQKKSQQQETIKKFQSISSSQFSLSQDFDEKMQKHKNGYERINILILLLPHDPILTNYLYELNKSILPLLLCQEMNKLLSQPEQQKKNTKKKLQMKILQKLSGIVLTIQTVLSSLSSSKISFKMIKEYVLSDEVMIWMRDNLKSIYQCVELRRKFIVFCGVAVDVCSEFLNDLFKQEIVMFSLIIDEELSRISREEPMLRDELDTIMTIAYKMGCEYPSAKKSISKKICQKFIECIGERMRYQDLQIINNIISVNSLIKDSVGSSLILVLLRIIKKHNIKINNILEWQKFKFILYQLLRTIEIMIKSHLTKKYTYIQSVISQIQEILTNMENKKFKKSDIFHIVGKKLKQLYSIISQNKMNQ